MYDTAQPYIAAYVIFRSTEGKIAFVLRENTKWMNDHYGFPSGKVEKAESFTQAAIREAKEETGVDVAAEDLTYKLTVHRHRDDMDWIDVVFEARTWTGALYNAEPHMHSELTWLDPKKLPENMIPYVKPMIEAINQDKNYLEIGWE